LAIFGHVGQSWSHLRVILATVDLKKTCCLVFRAGIIVVVAAAAALALEVALVAVLVVLVLVVVLVVVVLALVVVLVLVPLVVLPYWPGFCTTFGVI
jgi:Flp pilus assembly protein TadB